MRLARELLNFRRTMAFGIVVTTVTANLLPVGPKMMVAVIAWVCFLLLLMTYLFDIVYHSVGRKS